MFQTNFHHSEIADAADVQFVGDPYAVKKKKNFALL